MERKIRLWAGSLALLGAALLFTACGDDCDEYYIDDFWGNVFVDNQTDISMANEYVLGFYLAPVGEPFAGNLLGSTLPPSRTEFVGTFSEDTYDAEADMEFGDVVTFFDVFVGEAQDVYFEIQ